MSKVKVRSASFPARPHTSAAPRAACLPQLPTLCDHPRLKSVGTCRLCLVEARAGHEVPWADVPAGAALLHLGIVQADGGESKNVAACVTRVAEGMSYTSDSKAVRARAECASPVAVILGWLPRSMIP